MHDASKEDYLRTIYFLYESEREKNQGIRSVELAKSLKVTKPSVCDMIKKLVNAGYITAEPYSPFFFTRKGLIKAKRLAHNYRVLEVFLTDVLGYQLDEIKDEANRLEHACSEECIRRLDKFLDNPKQCPHGSVIHK